jgi:predicted NAD-dependent protein-ADP-ribosyltransferase YbiA (DUF1768 family)
MNLTPATPNAGPVLFYESQHYYLSNFSAFAVEWRGRVWPTSEHAYHASKFLDVAPAKRSFRLDPTRPRLPP